jgi:FtsZ-binding cell division protein ZapB
MEKNTLIDIINDLRSRRDALSLCHEHLKHDSDKWNKFIIILSLSTGLFESVKLQ